MWPHASQFYQSSGRWYLLSSWEGQSLHFIMFLNETRSIPNHNHICHSVTSNVRRMSKHTRNHLRDHNDFRSRDSSINIVWETLMTIPKPCSVLNSGSFWHTVLLLVWALAPIHCIYIMLRHWYLFYIYEALFYLFVIPVHIIR